MQGGREGPGGLPGGWHRDRSDSLISSKWICLKPRFGFVLDFICPGYDKCLIATGGKPKNLPQLENLPEEIRKRITLFRKVRRRMRDFDVDDEKVETPSEQVEDFKHLEAVTREAKSITIFGGEKTAADFYSFLFC